MFKFLRSLFSSEKVDIKVNIQKKSKFKLSSRSLTRMHGVHPELIEVVKLAIKKTSVDFGITCGVRTINEQKKLVSAGKSRTMRSRHITGHAVDVVAWVDGQVSWDMSHYELIADAFFEAGAELGVSVEWGGNWKSFKDGPHFQLSRSFYP